MEDINERLAELVSEMKKMGNMPAPSKGGNCNNLLDYRAARERILELCLAALDQGYRFVKEK